NTAATRLAPSTRPLATAPGNTRRSGCTSQSVMAITKRPGCACMGTRRWFIQARSRAAATRKKKKVSRRKSRTRMPASLGCQAQAGARRPGIELLPRVETAHGLGPRRLEEVQHDGCAVD